MLSLDEWFLTYQELLQSLICQEPLTTIPEYLNPNEHQLENLRSYTDPLLKCAKMSSLEDSLFDP
jgi:hypothetical protein